MIVKEYFYNIKCDRCGNECDESWYADPDAIESEAEDYEWIKIGDKHYCPECYEIDDNDNYVIKESNDNN